MDEVKQTKPQMKPKIIIIAGPSGSGKSTLMSCLEKDYSNRGCIIEIVHSDTTSSYFHKTASDYIKQGTRPESIIFLVEAPCMAKESLFYYFEIEYITLGLKNEKESSVLLEINDGGPAFPCPGGNLGMPILDWFAGQAMSGWIASFAGTTQIPDADKTAVLSYDIAAAMISEKTRRANLTK